MNTIYTISYLLSINSLLSITKQSRDRQENLNNGKLAKFVSLSFMRIDLRRKH
jgi:hypothetical protein